MRILFTGASSFTGYWFVQELARAGHDVVAVFRRPTNQYDGVRGERVRSLASCCRGVHGFEFGSAEFIELIRASDSWDVLCHHAAEVRNYQDADFDVAAAVHNNTRNLKAVLDALNEKNCRRVVSTGTVFEYDEGVGSEGINAFSPYGLSKGLSWQILRYHCAAVRFRVGKFVVPNPFGPYEEPRFTAYLMRCWKQGTVPGVKTPAYIRDNIHVSLLAKAYVSFVEGLDDRPEVAKANPSQYVESQGSFARRFADNVSRRLDLECRLEFAKQSEFPEPRIRFNADCLDLEALGWSESEAWDGLADYYASTLGLKKRRVPESGA